MMTIRVGKGRFVEKWEGWRWFSKRACCGSRSSLSDMVCEKFFEVDVVVVSGGESESWCEVRVCALAPFLSVLILT